MNIKICTKYICGEKILGIHFDKNAICNYCLQIEKLLKGHKICLAAAKNKFNLIINEIKDNKKNKK
jgi:hypothetical protein